MNNNGITLNNRNGLQLAVSYRYRGNPVSSGIS